MPTTMPKTNFFITDFDIICYAATFWSLDFVIHRCLEKPELK